MGDNKVKLFNLNTIKTKQKKFSAFFKVQKLYRVITPNKLY